MPFLRARSLRGRLFGGDQCAAAIEVEIREIPLREVPSVSGNVVQDPIPQVPFKKLNGIC